MLSMLQELENRFPDDGDQGLDILKSTLLDRRMQALIKIHQHLNSLPSPGQDNISQQNELIIFIKQCLEDKVSELHQLSSLFASSPHLTSLLLCHDQITRKDFEPSLPDLDASDLVSFDDEESVKVVRLVKGIEPLGATIALDEATNNIVFARILKGGPADRSGLIHVNDVLVEINKVPTQGKNPEELIAQLADFQGPLLFRLIPGEPHSLDKSAEEPMYVRAKFDYNPEEDPIIPCAQAGLRFRKNDVLQIVSKDDETWWQAALVDVGIHNGISSIAHDDRFSHGHSAQAPVKRAGLIPSATLQNRREALRCRRSETLSRSSDKNIGKGSNSSLTKKNERKGPWTLLRRTFRGPKRRLETTSLSELSKEFQVYDNSRFLSSSYIAYEDVVLNHYNMEEHPRFRPIVLIGPQGVGRNILKERLINSNPLHYGVPVPHTSRQKLPEEENGKDYYFVSRDFMEQGIRDKIFIEYGEYKGNLYGTSVDAIRAVMEDQLVCVLTPYPQALKMLWNGDLKPFTIFIKPPNLMTSTHSVNQSLSVEELTDLSLRGDKIELEHGDMFDYTIIVDNVDQAFKELLEVALSVENQPQWIPKIWM